MRVGRREGCLASVGVCWAGSRGSRPPRRAPLKGVDNIRTRNAVLAYDDKHERTGEDGEPVTCWERWSYKEDPTTGERVPDESAQVLVYFSVVWRGRPYGRWDQYASGDKDREQKEAQQER